MINLRYHIISITAVFLALGIGIAMGSSFLGETALDQIDRNIIATRNEARDARAEAAAWREEVAQRRARDEDLLEHAVGRAFADALADVPVVLLTVGGVDDDSLENLRVALASSRARFEGTLTVTEKVRAEGGAAEELAALLDREPVPASRLRAALVEAVAGELLVAAQPEVVPQEPLDPDQPGGDDEDPGDPPATGESGDPSPPATTTAAPTTAVPPPASSDPVVPGDDEQPGDDEPGDEEPVEEPEPEPEQIRALVEAGFFDFEPAPGGPGIDAVLSGRGFRFVVVTGPRPDVPDAFFLRPLIRALTEDRPAPVVVASAAVGDDAEDIRTAAMTPLLSDTVVAGRISTVDHLESFGGILATMLSLDDLGRDRRGHYGLGEGADSPIPRR